MRSEAGKGLWTSSGPDSCSHSDFLARDGAQPLRAAPGKQPGSFSVRSVQSVMWASVPGTAVAGRGACPHGVHIL